VTEDDSRRRFRIVRPGEHISENASPAVSEAAERSFPYPPGSFNRMFDLTGRVALVVGGGGGLCRAISAGMADFGARIAIADLNLDAAKATARACERPGIEPIAEMMDVTDPDMVQDVVNSIEERAGRIDVLLNGAGITIRKPATEFEPDEWMRIINTNLSGVFYVTQAVGRGMLARGYGRVLTIGSVSSLLGHPNNAPYAASKGGIAIMTKSLATEWAPRGVTVNAIGPAYTETELTRNILADPVVRQQLTAGIPMGRLGRPDDLVGAAIFLCSDAARFVTGQTLYIDGGRTAD
jgi:NAD(P)-dependent dehydrogenase (short-subunit alcohol dehydrogenase family)